MSKNGRVVRLPLVLEPQPEGVYTVTSPALQGLVTQGSTIEEALANAKEAFEVVWGFYEEKGKPMPESLHVEEADAPITAEILVQITVGGLIPA